MKKILIISLVNFLICVNGFSQSKPLWLRYPAISPNGEMILFNYQGDIYRLEAALSVHEYQEAEFNTFPNPIFASQLLRWDSNQSYSTASIMDLTGKVVYNTPITNTQTLQIPSLNRGVYLVSLENKTMKQVVKIVVE